MEKENLKGLEGKKNRIKSHPELVSGSLHCNNEMLNQVQHDVRVVQHEVRRGFTLIELLVVVLIIGILAAVALPQYQKAVDRARLAQVKAVFDGIRKSQKIYQVENGKYSTSLAELDLPPGGCEFRDRGSYENAQCDYSWGYCYLACTPAGSCGGCMLRLTSTDYLIFMSNSGWEGINCLAATNSARANRLCRADTGHETITTNPGQYTVYPY